MKHTPSRSALAVVACLALLFAGLAAVTPAGASFKDAATAAAGHNWNKIWNQKLKPKADKRYYTKTKSDNRYYTQNQADDNFYSKTDSDAKYYSKTETDAKYETKHAAYRGMYFISGTGAGSLITDSISFGASLTAPPVAHYIRLGDPVPAGCSGTVNAPNADPGHLCVWEQNAVNVLAGRFVSNTSFTPNTATSTGAYLFSSIAAAGNGYYGGTWVLRPGGSATVTNARRAPDMGPAGAEIPQ
jgi:hypothetical protein